MGAQDPERAWDEYDWERFLQQQDRKTEKYMELLEKYIDDPQRDEIVAREMGWSFSPDEAEAEWSEEADSLLGNDEELEQEDAATAEAADGGEGFEQHALYRASFNLTIWIDQLFETNANLQNDPAAVTLMSYVTVATSKLAAALSDRETAELGMTIAYLKRALKAITTAMDAAAQLIREKSIAPEEHAGLQQRLFQVRDGIIALMGQFRGEWLRRYGRL